MENMALHGLKTNACPQCEVPTHEWGTNAKNYRYSDYARYQYYTAENANSGSESHNAYVLSDNLGICHKSWLSKADFTWLIVMSHKVCWFSQYDVARLIAFTWLRPCESSLYYDWLIVSWLTIVTSYDVMPFAHDSCYESWVLRMWLIWAHD